MRWLHLVGAGFSRSDIRGATHGCGTASLQDMKMIEDENNASAKAHYFCVLTSTIMTNGLLYKVVSFEFGLIFTSIIFKP